ncbi:HNH endonuclease [Yersinia enterocolitica]|nr:HNH endonuclease [Yersinia enterocolitica]EKN5986895.1 HNH endonuclease [Yersinia enterocolitica]ELX2240505.1 HNH endonuclease [Yersinia enterocolitica]
MDWHKYFIYEPETGLLLNKISRYKARIGTPVGVSNGKGYLQVTLSRKPYRVHRIIWEMHNGPIPEGMQIDHIDHNRVNNRLNNLRVVTNKQNNQNRTRPSNNTSGTIGVYWNKFSRKWHSIIVVDGKEKSIGYFDDINNAVAARKQAERDRGFHPNHGMPAEDKC